MHCLKGSVHSLWTEPGVKGIVCHRSVVVHVKGFVYFYFSAAVLTAAFGVNGGKYFVVRRL